MGGVFPGAGATVYRNDAGEPIGWSYENYDEPPEMDPYDDYDDYDYDEDEEE